jgi:hypothetical protein
MTPDWTVTTWIQQLKVGNPEAAQVVWDRYFPRLKERGPRAFWPNCNSTSAMRS